MTIPARRTADHDVLLCCPDPAALPLCDTLEAYLARAGFRVIGAGAAGTEAADRQAQVESAPDFVFFVTEGSLEALRDPRSGAATDLAAAIASGRNVVRVSLPDGPAALPDDLAGHLVGLRRQQALVLDPDRLAESLSLIQHSLSSETTVADRHVMRGWKRWFQLAAALVIAGFLLQAAPQVIKWWKRPRPLPPVAPFTLYWTAFGERGAEGAAAEFPVSPGVALAGGDRVRVSFSPSADGNAYVLVKDVKGRVEVLFPRDGMKGASRVRAGQVYSAPGDTGWFAVDGQASIETLYIVAGYDAMQNLEELIEEPETPSNLGARRELIDQTLAGLLDGKHYQYGRAVWTRKTQVVDQGLKPAAGPSAFTATLSGGRGVTHRASAQPGLVSAAVELTFAK